MTDPVARATYWIISGYGVVVFFLGVFVGFLWWGA